MSKGRGDESYGAILLYMKNQNRPYSNNDLVSSSLKDHGKAQIQKSVDQFVAVSCYDLNI